MGECEHPRPVDGKEEEQVRALFFLNKSNYSLTDPPRVFALRTSIPCELRACVLYCK